MTIGRSVAATAGMSACSMRPTIATSLGARIGPVIAATSPASASAAAVTIGVVVVVVVVITIVVGVAAVVVVVSHHVHHHFLHLCHHSGFSCLEIGFAALKTVGDVVGWSGWRWQSWMVDWRGSIVVRILENVLVFQ